MATAKKTSRKTASKTSAKKSATKRASAKTSAKKTSAKKSAAKKTSAKKQSLVKQKRSTGSGPACWPGFERVPGKEAGTKGSCKPKKNQSAGEKKADSRVAAGSKLRKAGGNKGKANHMR